MEFLSRLQALDCLMVVVWAGIVGWGLQTGMIRQAGMLIAVYVGAIGASSMYKLGAQALGMVVGVEFLARWEFVAYLVIFAVVFAVLGVIIWRAYPLSRLGKRFGADNVVGAVISAVWGALLLIVIVVILKYYTLTPWRGQETSQQAILGQIESAQVVPVLEVVLAPLWQIMIPWFPVAVPPKI
jgi:hypothetical protein